MDDHREPNWDNQLWHARQLQREHGDKALLNPHGYTGQQCHCGTCFCCAAWYVFLHPHEE
jgi:hypothetical protein